MAHYIEVEKGIRLYVEDIGEGKPVVFLHGWPANHRMFEYQIHPLLAEGFRFIGVDLRGCVQKIDVPTRIFHGTKDDICPFDLAKEMDKNIANSDIVSFEESGHSLFYDEQTKFNDELVKFLKA